jgi:small subunit ribosomal protein S21
MQNMRIYVRNNDISKALRILKKKLNQEGDMKKLREKEFFRSDSQKKRLEKQAGRKRWLKKREQIEQRAIRQEQRPIKSRKSTSNTTYNSKKQVANS